MKNYSIPSVVTMFILTMACSGASESDRQSQSQSPSPSQPEVQPPTQPQPDPQPQPEPQPQPALAAFTAPDCKDALAQGTTTGGSEPTIEDMVSPQEGIPHGAIAEDGKVIGWSRQARVWRGNVPQPGWTTIVSTGMIYAQDDNQQWKGVRLAVRNIELFVKPQSLGGWCRLDSRASPGGALYMENFSGDLSSTVDLRFESNGGLSLPPVPGRIYHFWGNKVLLPAGDLSGVFVQFEARLIPDDGGTAAEMGQAYFLGSASADYWKSMSAPSGYVGMMNEDVAIARFKRLTPEWRVFTMNSNGGTAAAPAAR